MALKIAADDKNWLQATVLGERRKLAGLHKAALLKTSASDPDQPNDTEDYAWQSHEEGMKELGEQTYETVLEVPVKVEVSPAGKTAEVVSTQADGVYVDPNAEVKTNREAKAKRASELKYDESGEPPNTTTATQDHAFELKELAKQIAQFTGRKTEWDPNDMLKD